ncbi:MAG: hypothetical protein CMH30_05945 [Micavibrio sp.]|nr:hypothetical protein [Micavibrio sp.]|tara:strand:- start:3409 stop:5016 length:1608 start_codon:yes stop_codon:yes gene_type:complete
MDSDDKKFDAIILGIGHQSLIAATYLAKKNYKVCVLESPTLLPGSTPYEEFHEGVKTGPCAHMPVTISPEVIEDLNLESHGFSMSENHSSVFVPSKEQAHLFIGKNFEQTQQNIATLSAKDGNVFFDMHDNLSRLAELFESLDKDMPDYTQKGWKDLWAVFETARHLSSDNKDLQEFFTKIMKMSLKDFLDAHFENDLVKGMLSFHATIGSMVNPSKEGSASALGVFILGLGTSALYRGDWQPIRGSLQPYMKALTQSAMNFGVHFATSATVQKILIENNHFKGIETDDGIFTSPILIADTNPHKMFLDLMEPEKLPPEFKMRVESLGGVSGFIRVKLALKELPQFTCLNGADPIPYLQSDVTLSPDIGFIQTAYDQTMSDGGSQRPGVSLVFPSLKSPELAKDGLYACSLLGQYFEPNLPDTEENRTAVAKAIISTVNDFAPNFLESIVGFLSVMGSALDKTIGPLNTDLTGGALPLLKMFQRKFSHHALMADIPFEGIYMCGYGPESSANAHVLNAGKSVADYVSTIRKPAAA